MDVKGRAGGEVGKVRAPSGQNALGQARDARGQMIRMLMLTFIQNDLIKIL